MNGARAVGSAPAPGSGEIRITGTHQYDRWGAGVIPDVELVRPGLWSIPVPIPDNPLRYVLVYCLELDDGVALVDAGWDTEEAWSALGAGLAVAGGTVADVRGVLVTHLHPDHYGLAGRIRDESGAWIAMHPADAALIHDRYAEPEELLANMRQLLAESGIPADLLPDLAMASMMIRDHVALAEPELLLEDGSIPPLPGWDLRTVWTPGHSPGHICFHSEDRGLLLSGDHVLPRISPHVSLHTQQFPNPLGDFLASLNKVRDLPVEEVLPGHEYRFAGLEQRVDQLLAHHEARLAEIEDLLRRRPGSTGWELTTSLTWSRPWDEIPPYMQRGADGETLAHLALLATAGRIRREGGRPARFFVIDGRSGGGASQ